ncbi:ArsR/SmtB family transcription factor [Halosimplex pelagicum]|uniref:Helix-turn-helix domain-containing protein n=1 Tax=Halosimplex pelagicum TaxID=869886 RepID=A0A7D5TVT0_9EURY|nr:winged helix-turn-helix domain-containing protein [Halosimplex pelagicum]QLH83474.1 helix-turn-helix domain-containing protein [Halosimplex pelagicum]
MGRLLPFKSEPTRTPDEPRVLDLDDEATEEALSALSSDTARKILATLYEEPKTPPEIRDEVGTSLQNVHYHVERLEDAELIQPAGEGYSEKGTEMTIYAPASEALVLFAGREHDRSRLKTALTRLLGSVGLLAVASLAVRRLFGESGASLGDYGVSFGMGSQSGGERGAGDGGDGGGSDGASGGDGGDGASGGDGGGPEPGDDAVTSTTEGGDIGIFGGEDTATDAGGGTASPTPDPATATQSTPAATEVPSATPTPAGTPSPTPAGTPSPTPAGTPTPAATPSATPAPTATPTATTTPTATQTATPQPTPTTTEPPSPTPTETGMDSGTITLDTATQVPAETVDGARQVAGSGDALLADPAVAFFLGGLFMLLVVTAWWYVQG